MGHWILDEKDKRVDVGHFQGRIRVAYELMEPVDSDEPLRAVRAWVRLVIWTRPDGSQVPHVNIASMLDDLLRANLHQWKDNASGLTQGLFLTDYETMKFEVKDDCEPWGKPQSISMPRKLAEVVEAMRGIPPGKRTRP